MLCLLWIEISYKQLNLNCKETNVYTYFCICSNYDSSPSNSLESFLVEYGSENAVIAKGETIEDISDIVDTGS